MRIAAWLVLLAGACASHAESVCQDIGWCRGQSDDEVAACQSSAADLATEASASGCRTEYDAYFSCADDRYDCQGATPVFPGCETGRGALDACLARGRAQNACGALAAELGACGGGTAPDPAAPPAPCATSDVCAARCYLDAVADVCRPATAEVSAASRCAATCP